MYLGSGLLAVCVSESIAKSILQVAKNNDLLNKTVKKDSRLTFSNINIFIINQSTLGDRDLSCRVSGIRVVVARAEKNPRTQGSAQVAKYLFIVVWGSFLLR